MNNANLVPNRECASCTACCQFIGISDQKLEKPTNVLCPHCVVGQGCAVYEFRPSPCKGWYCGWGRSSAFDNSWRPDRCGIVIRPEAPGFTFVVLDPNKKFLTEEFASLVAKLIITESKVYFEAVGPEGFLPVKAEMNNKLMRHVQNRDLNSMFDEFRNFLHHVENNWAWEPDNLKLHTELKSD